MCASVSGAEWQLVKCGEVLLLTITYLCKCVCQCKQDIITMIVCLSHHGTDCLLPVRSLSGMDMSQFRHNVVVLQVTSRSQAPKIHKYTNSERILTTVLCWYGKDDGDSFVDWLVICLIICKRSPKWHLEIYFFFFNQQAKTQELT